MTAACKRTIPYAMKATGTPMGDMEMILKRQA
jgi:hypothetical protein